jgi:hypothetical protein
MTHAGCRDLDQDLPGTWSGYSHLFDSQRLCKLVHHRGFHSLVHEPSSEWRVDVDDVDRLVIDELGDAQAD